MKLSEATFVTQRPSLIWLLVAGPVLIFGVAGVLTMTRNHQSATQATSAPSIPAEIVDSAPSGPPPPPHIARQIEILGRSFGGRVGIVIRSIEDGWTASYGGGGIFPQQSVSKLWVAAAVLDRVDARAMHLSDKVTLTRNDLTIFHQPILKRIGDGSYTTDIAELMRLAITQSDNTANDVLFRRVGGQSGVGRFLARSDLGEIAIGPGEKILQTQAAGMTWDDSFSYDRTFWHVRETVPIPVRASALAAYATNPPDAATPLAIAKALARLKRGELLGPGSTSHLLDLMQQSVTGPDRLRGGLSEGWNLAHKTGTGQVMGYFATAYNDVGILTSPAGRHYALVVMIASTQQPVAVRQALMSSVTRAVIANVD
jgi:beta-lactamase class A